MLELESQLPASFLVISQPYHSKFQPISQLQVNFASLESRLQLIQHVISQLTVKISPILSYLLNLNQTLLKASTEKPEPGRLIFNSFFS